MIRLLTENDAERFAALRTEALHADPLAFGSTPEDDRFAAKPDAARGYLRRAPDAVVFGAFSGEQLVGMCALMREPHDKAAHKATIWSMYVQASARQQGLGAQLLAAVLDHAEHAMVGVAWLQLGVSVSAPSACKLYEAAGFEAWGEEPDALRHEGRSVAVIHMARRL